MSVPDSAAGEGPRGPFPAGVEDVIGLVARSYRDRRPSDGEHWVFLIGAPGNGKSEALRDLARALGLSFPPRTVGGRAPRSYDFAIPRTGVRVRLVNDASIRRSDAPGGGSLRQDMTEAANAASATGQLLFANVNRGVLVEEAQGGTGAPSGTAAGVVSEMVSWLNRVASGEEDGDASRASYRHSAFEVDGTVVNVHALVLDCTSVFEPRPGRGGQDIEFHPSGAGTALPYRPIGSLDGDRSGSIAAALLEQVVAHQRWEGAGCATGCNVSRTCPYLANVRWLRDPALARDFLALGRAAEVASGRRMTYRDLLGHLALAVIGRPEEEWLSGMSPCGWVAARVAELPASANAAGRLASHRVYTSLFPAPSPAATTWRPGPGAVSRTALTPVVVEAFGKAEQGARAASFAPAYGTLDPCKSVDGWDGRRFATLDAAEAMHVEEPTSSLARSGVLPPAAVSGVEEALDQAMSMVLGSGATGATMKHRAAQAHAWRTILLLRQVGLASGAFADRVVVEEWLYAQSTALLGTGQSTLSNRLRTMLIPRQGSLVVAPYRPRTRAFEGALPPNTLFHLHRSEELRVELRAVKDGLQAVLQLGSEGADNRLVPVPVDLDLAREALVAASPLGGFTDLPDRTLARVERARASLMSYGRSSGTSASLHVTDGTGRLYRVVGEPGHASVQEAHL